jgi:hypothetical protein
MRPTDPFIRRLRLHVAYRLAARLVVADQAARDHQPWRWRAAVSAAVDVISTVALIRRKGASPPSPLLSALTTVDAVAWSGLGGEAPINARGLAVLGVSAAIEAGYRLGADDEERLATRLRDVVLSVVPTLSLCSVRRLRHKTPGWGLAGWPVLGATAGYGLALYTRAEERRRRATAADLDTDLILVAQVVGAAAHTEPTTWNQVSKLENGLLVLSRHDPTIAEAWRKLLSAPPIPPPGYVRLASLAPDSVGDENPLLHPRHVEQLEALGVADATVRALPSPGLLRPGDRLEFEVDGNRVVLLPTRHRFGSDTADRFIDPAPIVLAWGASLVGGDWTAYRPPIPLVASVAALQCAVGVAHARLRLSPAETLRNAFLAAGSAIFAGAAVRQYRDPTGTPGIVFGGAVFPSALLLGNWWNTIDAAQRRRAAAGALGLSALMALRCWLIQPPEGRGRWWLRTFLLDNTLWWPMLFVTAMGLDSDRDEDLSAAMEDAGRAADIQFDDAFARAWDAARERIAARASILDRAMRAHGHELEPDVAVAIERDLEEVVAWLAEPSS